MLRSIATVSLGGTLVEKLHGHRGGRLRRRGDFRERPAVFRRLAGRGEERSAPTSACASCCSSRSAISRPRRAAAWRRTSIAPRRKFDVMEQLGADLMLVCSNTAPDTHRRRQRRGRRPARARRARGAARLPHRLRGARLGPAGQQVRPCLEDRAGGGPSGGRARGRHLPHLRDRGRRCADRARFPATASSSRSLPTRR